ncbi:flagellar capping protein [Gracilibacillus halophilus YIM-C55.5]|uniref:Flagellar hook-associated protein 2 n=1 Tax=Gracilibacillus halophilus YIM-C55.5 TaxID=1308866 RepID=N4WZE4_9BACI|nr:flagellar hook-associated protein 2 [Gracilibacillus halophilus]ENH98401.1 flagellar capping protein [Gracilibacillus halophilus YIM-C55.5]
MAYSVNTSNRVTGLASGIDTESMVKELMNAERKPLDKMNQDLKWQTWKRDAYREVNKLFSELDQKVLDMKLESTYSQKSTSSTNSSAVTASATPSASSGSYQIEVNQLATSAINMSESTISGSSKIDADGKLSEQDFAGSNITGDGSFNITYYNENGEGQTKNISYSADESLNTVLDRIGSETNNEIRASYDENSDKVILERTKTGNFNKSDEFLGAEIGFDGQSGSDFLVDTLQVKNGEQQDDGSWDKVETGGTDASFLYNGKEFTPHENSYEINNITFNFHGTTQENSPATVTVNEDVESSFEQIKGFVEKYNEVIDEVNGKLNAERNRDYQPLTDAQKDEMSENEIELWNEKAKSGMLRNDSILSGGMSSMRRDWYSTVDNDGAFQHLSEIGISTTSNYMDGGKLEINETKLKDALREDPDSVHKLFSNDVEGSGRGIINRLEDSMDQTINRVEERAGKAGATLQTYTLGRQMVEAQSEISDFEERLTQVENRYWDQFTRMEQAIQQMNAQSSQLSQMMAQ